MRILDTLRTQLGIRKSRQLLPIGVKPQVGSNIVLKNMCLRLKFPIDDDLWNWLIRMGWRTTDLRKDRRLYVMLSERILIRLLKADEQKRNVIHQHLIDSIMKEDW